MARTTTHAGTRIRLCGSFALQVRGRDVTAALPDGQPTTVLAYLAASPGQAADRDALIAVLWPQRAPRDPSAALRPILSRLRRAIAPAELDGRERLRLILPEPVRLDLDEAAERLEGARVAARDHRWSDVRAGAQAALDVFSAGLLPGIEGDWLDTRRREVDDLVLEALEWQARAGLAPEAPDLAAGERAARELIARSPYRETGHRFLMESLAAGGNVAEALRAYEDLRVLLREELGTAPAAELQALHGRLLAGETIGPATPRAHRAPLPALMAPRERSAFVGRAPELDALRSAWHDVRSGERRLVFVAGEPGIGKTRLARELAREAHETGTVLYAGFQEDALISYQPFVEALRHYARSSGRDWSQVSLGPGTEEIVRLVPELAAAQPVPAPADPGTRRYMLFEAVSLLLADAAARAPVLLVLDDLHWADRGTLHLLRHFVRSPHAAALLVVGTYRPADVDPQHPLTGLLADLRRDRLFERISLAGLGQDDVGDLIAAHAGRAVPGAVVHTVHERTEGNPFFVEEVMRDLIETGKLVERDGRWASAITPEEIGVPEGVREVLGSRLTRLSDGCRDVLSRAAVLGREFSFEVLAAMVDPGDEGAVIDALEEAGDAQLVFEQDDSAQASHAFTHALVRETLYVGLSTPRRRRLHADAARAIERVEGATAVATLALHYRLAGAAGDLERAIETSLAAGAQAAGLSAWEDAAVHWEGALALMERRGGLVEQRARLLVALAELMVVVGDLDRQIAFLRRALALYEEVADVERAAQVHSRLGMAHSLMDSIDAEHLDILRAFEHFDAARAVLERGPVRRALGHLETGISTALTYGLRIPAGIEAAARGMEIGERIGDDLLWAGAAEAYGWHKIVAGELREGFAMTERAFEVADREQRPFLAFMATNIRGQWTWALSAPDEAQAFFERPLRLPYVGKTSYRHEIADGVGRCHLARGELDDARRLVGQANAAWFTHALSPLLDLWDGRWSELAALTTTVLETSRRTGNRWDEWAAHFFAGRIQLLRGDLEPGLASLKQGLAIVAEGGAAHFELWVRPELARGFAQRGELTAARHHLDRCAELVGNGEDWRGRAGHVACAEGLVLAGEDRLDAAIGAFERGLACFERYRLPGDEADVLREWGLALGRAGDGPAAREKLDLALEILQAHDAGPPWLERVAAERRRLR